MAKGNIGNLLQHFVALNVAEKVINYWNKPESPIEYVDCFSMAPWESLDCTQPQGFERLINTFPTKRNAGDFVANVFINVWNGKYCINNTPVKVKNREYPNTAVLLRTAFPNQNWNMRLHDIKPENAQALNDWANLQTLGTYSVNNDWKVSRQIMQPAPVDRPVLIMLDPNKICEDNTKDNNLTQDGLRFLFGSIGLNAALKRTSPFVVCLFSYSDNAPDVPDGIVRTFFNNKIWNIEHIKTKRNRTYVGNSYHQAWIVSKNIETPILLEAQNAWDNWVRI